MMTDSHASGIRIHLDVDYPADRETGFALHAHLHLPGSGITAVFGPSGSGKTTLLRCLAGLQRVEGAIVEVNGVCWQDHKRFLPTHQRELGYVFQEPSLFPHLTAGQNIEYAAKRTRAGKQPQTLSRLSDVLGLDGLLSRSASLLSGGEKQRVAIARALVCKPRLLLMDEPLASLDRARKQEILPFLERVHAELSCPVLYVSHAMDEVTRLADHVVLIDQGQVVSQGSLNSVFGELGDQSAFPESGSVVEAKLVHLDPKWQLATLRFSGGELCVTNEGEGLRDEVRLHIPAKDVSIALTIEDKSSIANRISAIVERVDMTANTAAAIVRLRCGEDVILARVTRRSVAELSLREGLQVFAQIKSVAIVR